MGFDFVRLVAVQEGLLDAKAVDFGLDLKRELWKNRVAVEGLETCLMAIETAKGRRRRNDIVVLMLGGPVDDDVKNGGVVELRAFVAAAGGKTPVTSIFRGPKVPEMQSFIALRLRLPNSSQIRNEYRLPVPEFA
jgi:hypothetical protein